MPDLKLFPFTRTIAGLAASRIRGLLTAGTVIAWLFCLVPGTGFADSLPRNDIPYFAGMGIMVTFCSSCHDVGPIGPRVFGGARGPDFTTELAEMSEEEIFNYFKSSRDSDSSHLNMPPIGLTDKELQFSAHYLYLFIGNSKR